ncbi:hypothetical protein AB0911_37415 [Streptomyces nigra]|uniref:hypothetical protein n=1 Tax=Streptomyces nigra TaxID=1827580 RepID=UPI00345588F1
MEDVTNIPFLSIYYAVWCSWAACWLHTDFLTHRFTPGPGIAEMHAPPSWHRLRFGNGDCCLLGWRLCPVCAAAAAAVNRLGVHRNTAQAALTQCRAQRMADVMEQRALSAAQAAAAFDYPASQTRRASVRAEAISRLRIRRLQIRILPSAQQKEVLWRDPQDFWLMR